MILLIGIKEDPTLNYFSQYLQKRNEKFYFLDQSELGIKINVDTSTIYTSNMKLELKEITGIFNRVTGLNPNVTYPNYRYAQMSLLYHLIESSDAKVANKLVPGSTNFSKPFQLNLISTKKLRIPRSYIVANAYLPIFEEEVIYKSVSSERSIVQKLTSNDLEKPVTAPVLFQAFIKGDNIRVHVVNDQVFPLKISTKSVDYRYAKGEINFDLIELPREIAQECISITKECGLIFSGVDLIKSSKHNYYVLEVNPSPGYSYFEKEMSSEKISEALLNYLNC